MAIPAQALIGYTVMLKNGAIFLGLGESVKRSADDEAHFGATPRRALAPSLCPVVDPLNTSIGAVPNAAS